mmetsp:Transcript_34278/g.82561  ORF Transcript_34278/g.82561 Transcript_34278/m.82561 type:complete len:219 (-) Transcript_34278:2379-3035(-)
MFFTSSFLSREPPYIPTDEKGSCVSWNSPGTVAFRTSKRSTSGRAGTFAGAGCFCLNVLTPSGASSAPNAAGFDGGSPISSARRSGIFRPEEKEALLISRLVSGVCEPACFAISPSSSCPIDGLSIADISEIVFFRADRPLPPRRKDLSTRTCCSAFASSRYFRMASDVTWSFNPCLITRPAPIASFICSFINVSRARVACFSSNLREASMTERRICL